MGCQKTGMVLQIFWSQVPRRSHNERRAQVRTTSQTVLPEHRKRVTSISQLTT